MTVQKFAAQEKGKFDLIVLADVLHHVPAGPLRQVHTGDDQGPVSTMAILPSRNGSAPARRSIG